MSYNTHWTRCRERHGNNNEIPQGDNLDAVRGTAIIRKGDEKMLELRNISFDVDENSKTKGILKNINLKLEDNKFVVVTGPNGGGKSTLAKIIAGIEKPSGGQIFWNGEDITEMSVTDRAKAGISYAFQQPVRFKGITVFDLIQLATGKHINVEKACEYLSEVGLCAKDYIRREVNASLSGGELKRIEIATVMARNTAMTIFDEPEAGIDLWSFQNLIHVFEKLHQQNHGSIMIISHQERILNIADQIVMIADGQLQDMGTREEMLPKIFGQIDRPVACECKYYENH